MLRKLLFSIVICLVCSIPAFSQTGSIQGTVIDSKSGDIIPSANVYLKEAKRGAATNKNGEYTINNLPTGTYTLRVTFVGYQAHIEKVNITEGKNVINVSLKSGAIGLDQIVITGTGPQTERSLTNAVSNVSSAEFEKVPLQNSSSILQGRAAGVQVTQTSGNPGGGLEVRVRGQGSINAGSRPLYIVDGVEISFSNRSGTVTESPLNGINPDDIESISVLKDAAATAIYGAQGANGVVLITTKRGQSGETKVSATVERGVRDNIKSVDYFNRDQFLEYFTRAGDNSYGQGGGDAYLRDFVIPSYGVSDGTRISPLTGAERATYSGDFSKLPDTDWRKFNNQNGVTQNYRMTISGGTDQVRYRLSGGYENSDGHVKNYNYQDYHLRSNFDFQISSKFSTKLNLALSNQKTAGSCQDGFYINCPIAQQGFLSPLAKPYNDDGTYSTGFPLIGANNNPAVQFNERTRNSSTVHLIGDLSGTYDFAQWISLTTQFGMDWRQIRDEGFSSPVSSTTTNGSKFHQVRVTPNFNTTTTLNFNKSFDDVNNFSALVGFEYRRDFTRYVGATAQQFLGSAITVLNGGAKPITTAGYRDEFRKAGYYGNVKYNYDQRYYINLTGRYEGSSRFGSNSRFGFFPAASAAWDISAEDFLNANWINDLKIRVSYGQSGNSQIGRYAALGLYSIGERNINGFLIGGPSYNGTSALGPNQIANPDLTWESATSLDFGVDWSFFNSRFSGTIDVYQTDHSDLLLDSPLPNDSGYFSLTRNVGKTRNKGIEFSFNSVNIRAGDFEWRSNFNITVQKNTVKELNGGAKSLYPASSEPVAVGHSIHALKIVKWAGVNPADGRPMWYDKDGNITYNPTPADRKFFDGGEQDAVGGFGNTFNYKGISLNFLFQYSYGQTAVPQLVWFFNVAQIGSTQGNGIVDALENSWQKPGDFSKYPYPHFGSSTYPGTQGFSQGSSNAYYDASYIRLKNLSLSYDLPESITQSLHVQNVQLYVSGLNLLTWTSYIGFDPEIAGPGGGTTAQSASYPAARVINGGINIKF